MTKKARCRVCIAVRLSLVCVSVSVVGSGLNQPTMRARLREKTKIICYSLSSALTEDRKTDRGAQTDRQNNRGRSGVMYKFARRTHNRWNIASVFLLLIFFFVSTPLPADATLF